MPKSLNEPSLLAVGAELGIVGGGGVELRHADDSVLGQQRLTPKTTNVVNARGDEHVSHRTSESNRICLLSILKNLIQLFLSPWHVF